MTSPAAHDANAAAAGAQQAAAPITALVLAGGQARRLGGGKALLDVGGSSLLRRALELAHAVSDDVLLAPGPRGYRAAGARVVADEPVAPGPLGGLLAGLAAARHEWLLLLPCDLPFGDAALVAALAQRAAHTPCDAVLLHDAFGLQPFHGLYRRRALSAGRSAALRGVRALRGLIDTLVVEPLAAPQPVAEPGPLFDVDTPGELELARAHAARVQGTGAS